MNFFRNIFKPKAEKSVLDDFYNTKYSGVKTLLCGIGKSEILEDHINISEYPFEPSIAYPKKRISPHKIHAISLDFGTCSIEVGDDIIFISATQKDQLKDFAKRHDITLVKHRWNWDWILEPYLDTEFTPEDEKKITEKLSENGINTAELEAIRKEVGSQMYKYNFDTMLWDWNSLGLVDVLSAMRAKYNTKDFRIFYKIALEIDKKGGTK
ncbi:hypothetical protein [uncultured Formosa sp.]|uniref:hypothetical protein n=1 Tax=uncultured Formosa sp. TaxID=255435 RepID=UPI00261F25BE|nr:hypothetical protein [uncultured Formosa sp.]